MDRKSERSSRLRIWVVFCLAPVNVASVPGRNNARAVRSRRGISTWCQRFRVARPARPERCGDASPVTPDLGPSPSSRRHSPAAAAPRTTCPARLLVGHGDRFGAGSRLRPAEGARSSVKASRPSRYMFLLSKCPCGPRARRRRFARARRRWAKAGEDHSMGPAARWHPVRTSVISASTRPAAVRVEAEDALRRTSMRSRTTVSARTTAKSPRPAPCSEAGSACTRFTPSPRTALH